MKTLILVRRFLSILFSNMASEADLSLSNLTIESDDTCITSATGKGKGKGKGKKGRGKAAYTTYMHSCLAYLENKEDSTEVYCIYCKPPNKIYSLLVTTNFRLHLRTAHQITIKVEPSKLKSEVLDQLSQLYLQAEASGQTEEIDCQVFRRYLSTEAIQEALVSLIVVRGLAFQAVEWPKLHVLCQTLNPEAKDFIVIAYSTVAKKIKDS